MEQLLEEVKKSYVDVHEYDDVGVGASLFVNKVEEQHQENALGMPKICYLVPFSTYL